jgi:hypothetical protein
MKKFVLGTLCAVFVLGAGTAVFAAENGENVGIMNFGQMKPHMEEMHPDLSTKELKEMFDHCHGTGGEMNGASQQSMMNNL